MTLLSPLDITLERPPLVHDVEDAVQEAYVVLAQQGYDPEQIYRLPVCDRATEALVASLVSKGYLAHEELKISSEVGAHRYAVLPGFSNEIIIDLTWGQLLPTEVRSADLPKILSGSRKDVMVTARALGVASERARIWEAPQSPINVAEHREQDRQAANAADQAAEQGMWGKFMSLPKI